VTTVEGVIKTTITLLVDGEYETLASLTSGKMLSADLMRKAIDDYGRTLVMPPDEVLRDLFQDDRFHGEVEGASPRRYWYDVPLWTVEEGRSDLELRLGVIEIAPGLYDVELEVIYVP